MPEVDPQVSAVDIVKIPEEELFQRELTTLTNVRDIYRTHGPQLKIQLQENDTAGVYELINNNGFTVEEHPLGYTLEMGDGKEKRLTKDNSVCLGPNRTLHVAVDDAENPIDMADLVHDAGACLLGGSEATKDQVAWIRFDTLNAVATRSTGEALTREELEDMRLLPFDSTVSVIPDTKLLFTLVEGKLPYATIKNIYEAHQYRS